MNRAFLAFGHIFMFGCLMASMTAFSQEEQKPPEPYRRKRPPPLIDQPPGQQPAQEPAQEPGKQLSRDGLQVPLLRSPAGPAVDPKLFRMRSLEEIFDDPAGDFDHIFSPFTQAKGGRTIRMAAIKDFEDGCKQMTLVYTSKQHFDRWLGTISKTYLPQKAECLARAAKVLKYMSESGQMDALTLAARRMKIVEALSPAEGVEFQRVYMTAKIRLPLSQDPTAKYEVYEDRGDGQYEFLEFDPAYPNLYFAKDAIYQKAKDGYGQVIDLDQGEGRLTAAGYLASPGVHEDLLRLLEADRSKNPDADELNQRAELAAALMKGLNPNSRARNLAGIVKDLLELRKKDRAGLSTPGQTGLTTQQVLDFLSTDPLLATEKRRLQFALTEFSMASEPADACEKVCSLFSKEKYDKWKLGDTALASGSEGSMAFGVMSLQARFALEAEPYCKNAKEVKAVFDAIVPAWLKGRTDFKTNKTKGDTEYANPYKGYGKNFSILFDRQFHIRETEKAARTGKPVPNQDMRQVRIQEREQYEDLLTNDLLDPRFAAEHAGGSNLGNTTFHYAYAMLGAPRSSEKTQKALEVLKELTETCESVNGSVYRVPYYIEWKNGKIDPASCKSPTASDDGAAARVVPIHLALYLKDDHQSIGQRREAKRKLEGALQQLYMYSGDLKGLIEGDYTHIGATQKAPYYFYPALASAATALSILERDFPEETERYQRIKKAFRGITWDLWNKERGLFDVHGTTYQNSDQFNQPLAGLAMLGFGVCKGAMSFALADRFLDVPDPRTLSGPTLKFETFDTSKLRGGEVHAPLPQKRAPRPLQRLLEGK